MNKIHKFFCLVFCMLLGISIAGCSTAHTTYTEVPAKDPYEPFNRAMFNFNDKLDIIVLKPVATLYNKITPKPLNKGIANFYNNIGNIPTIINDLLQINLHYAASDFWRFGINSTVGILGFFDVASHAGVRSHTNDFGLTLARWGYQNSNYVVWPFFGPSTVRDGIGIPIDYVYFSIYPYIHPTSTRCAIYGLGVVQRRAQLLKYQDLLEEAALDKYLFLRDAYLQRRAHQIAEVKAGWGYQSDENKNINSTGSPSQKNNI